jgi:hypothetical protein
MTCRVGGKHDGEKLDRTYCVIPIPNRSKQRKPQDGRGKGNNGLSETGASRKPVMRPSVGARSAILPDRHEDCVAIFSSDKEERGVLPASRSKQPERLRCVATEEKRMVAKLRARSSLLPSARHLATCCPLQRDSLR